MSVRLPGTGGGSRWAAGEWCMAVLMLIDVCRLSVCAPFFASPTALPPSPFASPAILPISACGSRDRRYGVTKLEILAIWGDTGQM